MGFLQRIFGRPAEARSSGSGYTVQVMAARDSYLSGRAGIGELTGTVQTCVTLWEAAFALADVAGTPFAASPDHGIDRPLSGVTRRGAVPDRP